MEASLQSYDEEADNPYVCPKWRKYLLSAKGLASAHTDDSPGKIQYGGHLRSTECSANNSEALGSADLERGEVVSTLESCV